MLRLSDSPPVLTPAVESLRQLCGRWWVAHTKSRFEKAFAWDLLRHGIGYFLPMVQRVRISGGRKRRVMAPLFPSYVFFCGNEADRCVALATDRLCQVLRVADQEVLIDQLGDIERAMAGKAVMDPYPFAVTGRRCCVKAGPFRGLEGVVVNRNKVARLVLEVSILGQGAAIEIDADLLEPGD